MFRGLRVFRGWRRASAFGQLRIVGATLHASGVLLGMCALLPYGLQPAYASEARAKELAERVLPGHKVEAIRRLPDLPFYEIWIRRSILYTDLDAKVAITGDMLDGKSLKSLRDARIGEMVAFKSDDIPRETVIKTVKGRGENSIFVFSDPHCSFCRRFEAELRSIDNATIYTVVYPALGPESLTRAREILCAAQPAQAWVQWMESAIAPPNAPESCKVSFDKILVFGQDKNISVTPTTLYADGFRMAGFVPAMTVRDLAARARARQQAALRSR